LKLQGRIAFKVAAKTVLDNGLNSMASKGKLRPKWTVSLFVCLPAVTKIGKNKTGEVKAVLGFNNGTVFRPFSRLVKKINHGKEKRK